MTPLDKSKLTKQALKLLDEALKSPFLTQDVVDEFNRLWLSRKDGLA